MDAFEAAPNEGNFVIESGYEFLCWFIATSYARRKCLLVRFGKLSYRFPLLVPLFSIENILGLAKSWAFVGIIDEYFAGYYTEDMIESQVDQLIFEELMRERFPKLVNHLDYLGVQVPWISGSWFLSIFVNIIPWESVLRVWDVLLFEGNRVMLFRTALALMELYGPALVTTKDAGDAITSLQSLVGSTFDSSQLVFTACMGYLAVTEARLKELREKHLPSVLVVIEERSMKGRAWKNSKGVATKLYSFKHDRGSMVEERKTTEESDAVADGSAKLESRSSNLNEMLNSLNVDSELEALPDPQDQVASSTFYTSTFTFLFNSLLSPKRPLFVKYIEIYQPLTTILTYKFTLVVWLKVELCRLLEEKRSTILRAEELETALMEMVKEDNRLELNARIEQLEEEVAELQQTLDDKKEQEVAMLQVLVCTCFLQCLFLENFKIFSMPQVLVRLEQDQKITEDARRRAEQGLATQKLQVHELQEKYDKAMQSIAEMQKRVVMAESMLEATLQYESGQSKALSSPRAGRGQSPKSENPSRKIGLLRFGLGWRDRNKSKPNAETEESGESLHNSGSPKIESDTQETDR
ncbi:hypothetical protein ACSQ67_014829 [Phaseolus vulgaris]